MAVLSALFLGVQTFFLIQACSAQLVSLPNGLINTDINNIYSNNLLSNNGGYSNVINEVIYNNGPTYTGNDILSNNNILSNNYAQNIGIGNEILSSNNILSNSYAQNYIPNDLGSVNIGNGFNIPTFSGVTGINSFGISNGISNVGLGNNLLSSNIIGNPSCSGNLNILQNNLAQNVPGLSIAGSSPIISNIVPNLQVGEMSLTGDLPVRGSIKVCGCLPVYGVVSVDGAVPSCGSAYANSGCNFASQIVGTSCGCAY